MQQKGKGGLWVTTDKHVLVNFSSLVAEVVLHSGVAVYEKKITTNLQLFFFQTTNLQFVSFVRERGMVCWLARTGTTGISIIPK